MGHIYYFIYRFVIYLLVPAVVLRGLIRRKYRQRLMERFGRVSTTARSGSIWIHAVSVGEVNAVKPLVDHLLEYHDAPVLLSCVTPTGSAQITRLFGDRVSQVYAPVDAGVFVERTVRAVRPRVIIIAETELWPNLLRVAQARKVPVAFINLRLSDKSFSRARRLLPLCRFALQNVASFCVQTSADAERVIALGAARDKVLVTGNLKFDVSPPDGIPELAAQLRERWGGAGCPTVVLGSSHEGEETGFMATLVQLRKVFPGLTALIAPRHPERFDRVFQQVSGYGLSVERRSQWQDDQPSSADVILVDSMGELLEFYAASDVAVVGGSFAAAGGHNVLEPILVGTPALFGPDMSNFREISQRVIEQDAGEMVASFDALKETLTRLLSDPQLRDLRVRNGRQLLLKNRGALQQTVDQLRPLLE